MPVTGHVCRSFLSSQERARSVWPDTPLATHHCLLPYDSPSPPSIPSHSTTLNVPSAGEVDDGAIGVAQDGRVADQSPTRGHPAHAALADHHAAALLRDQLLLDLELGTQKKGGRVRSRALVEKQWPKKTVNMTHRTAAHQEVKTFHPFPIKQKLRYGGGCRTSSTRSSWCTTSLCRRSVAQCRNTCHNTTQITPALSTYRRANQIAPSCCRRCALPSHDGQRDEETPHLAEVAGDGLEGRGALGQHLQHPHGVHAGIIALQKPQPPTHSHRHRKGGEEGHNEGRIFRRSLLHHPSA